MTLLLPHLAEPPEGVKSVPGEEGLAPFRLTHLTPGVALPFHLFAASGGFPEVFVPVWPRDRVLVGLVREEEWGYVAVSEAGEVLAYLLSRLEESPGVKDSPPKELLGLLADTLLIWTQHFYCHESARTPEGLAQAQELISRLDRELAAAGPGAATVGRLRRHDSGIFSHCLNVCLLGLVFLLDQSWEAGPRETFALGALLHDVGMMPQARHLFHQTAPLSDQDWEEINAHPERGAHLLQDLGSWPPEVLSMVRQHHESMDGSGYPQGLGGDAIHPWSHILRILDSYEAITSFRPWRPPISARQALHIMTSAWSAQGAYDQEYLQRFLGFSQGE